MTTPYSRRPEVVAAVRAFLISVRDRPDDLLPRYGEVAEVYGGIARAVAPVLNSVARDCAQAGEPDLSALVVLYVGLGLKEPALFLQVLTYGALFLFVVLVSDSQIS